MSQQQGILPDWARPMKRYMICIARHTLNVKFKSKENDMNIYGIVPARMGSSRFPGKPLYPICGRPLVEHVFLRARQYTNWEKLLLATCDQEIADFAITHDFPHVMTSDKHVRCLDRVAEAIQKTVSAIQANDVVVCVQGDEPMLHPEMIAAVVKPMQDHAHVNCTMLAMPIVEESQFYNPDIVKIIHDMQGDVLYTSRSPVPYCAAFNPAVGAKRVSGIFAFRWHFLQTFTQLAESPLELQESCDSNRIMDHGFKQRIALYPYQPYFSVDSPPDIALVEEFMTQDSLWGSY
jgi:3-deoxy-manno-octulosonate cytidylyltransferase (CMP-KDO synthetase)